MEGPKTKELFDKVFAGSERLGIIEPHDKGMEVETIERARALIDDANRVFILGYGFDENNNERLGLRSLGDLAPVFQNDRRGQGLSPTHCSTLVLQNRTI
jgi:hypothetical protein